MRKCARAQNWHKAKMRKEKRKHIFHNNKMPLHHFLSFQSEFNVSVCYSLEEEKKPDDLNINSE